MHIWDIAQNSIDAEADKIVIIFSADKNDDCLTIKIKDNGKGMDDEALKKALDPFYTSKPSAKRGFGLPFFEMGAKQTGGSFAIASKPKVGTVVKASFVYSHIDRVPLGDIGYAIGHIICLNEEIEIEFILKTGDERFYISTGSVKAVLENLTLKHPKVTELVCEFISLNIQDIVADLY
ncbi:MAG: ATP-binding protein [Defluviitaleaceae bacterium]|nr:ATP-binding protein [Defluviitaleaceae bacterium]